MHNTVVSAIMLSCKCLQIKKFPQELKLSSEYKRIHLAAVPNIGTGWLMNKRCRWRQLCVIVLSFVSNQ